MTQPDAVGKHCARWKYRIPNEFNEAPQILTPLRLRRSDSTKLIQNDPDFIHFGTILALQSGLERAEMCGLQLWLALQPIILSAVVSKVAHRIAFRFNDRRVLVGGGSGWYTFRIHHVLERSIDPGISP